MVLNDIFALMGLQFVPPGLCSLSTCCWVLNRHLRYYMSGRSPALLPQLWCSYSPIPPLLLSQLKQLDSSSADAKNLQVSLPFSFFISMVLGNRTIMQSPLATVSVTTTLGSTLYPQGHSSGKSFLKSNQREGGFSQKSKSLRTLATDPSTH